VINFPSMEELSTSSFWQRERRSQISMRSIWLPRWGGSNWSVPMGPPHVLLAEMGCHDCFCLFEEMSPQPPNKVGMDLPRVAAPPRLTPARVDTITASKDVVQWAPLVEPAPYADARLPYPAPLQPVWETTRRRSSPIDRTPAASSNVVVVGKWSSKGGAREPVSAAASCGHHRRLLRHRTDIEWV
jgi:hypothetical protein